MYNWVKLAQKDKPFTVFMMQRWWSVSIDIGWTVCKSFIPYSCQDSQCRTSALKFCRPDAFPDTQPTVSKHWRPILWM